MSSAEGPAWTRPATKKRTAGASLYSTQNASSSSSSLPPPTEAPYLTHTVRHLGQITLVPPDNLGRQRMPHTLDVEPSGQDSETQPPAKQKKKKKKVKPPKEPNPAILDAVLNAGRNGGGATAGPSSSGDARSERSIDVGADSTGGRNIDGGTLGVAAPAMGRTRSSESQRRRQARAQAAQARLDADERERMEHERDRRATTETSAGAATITPRPTPSSSAANRPAPASELDSHASLVSGLGDSGSHSPPPAYVRPSSPVSTSTEARRRDPPALSVTSAPVSESSPTSPPAVDLLEPTPPVSPADAAGQSTSSVVSAPEPTDDFAPDIALLPSLNPSTETSLQSDIFRMAWEQDIERGLTLDERVTRDSERRETARREREAARDRTSATVGPPSYASSRSSSGEAIATTSSTDNSSHAPVSPAHSSPDSSDAMSTQTQALARQLSRRASTQGHTVTEPPRLGRALSMYAGRRIAEAAERRRERERIAALVESQQSHGLEGQREEGAEEAAKQDARQSGVILEDQEEDEAQSPLEPQGGPSPTQQPVATQDTPREPEEQEREEGEEEEEEEEEESDDDDAAQLARQVTMTAHRRFAEAAERRIRAEREAKERERAAQEEDQTRPPTFRANDEEDLAESPKTHESNEAVSIFATPDKPFGVSSPTPSRQSGPIPAAPPSGRPLTPTLPASVIARPSATVLPEPQSALRETAHSPIASSPPIRPRTPSPPPVPSTAFRDLVGTAPLTRPRAPTINELLERAPSPAGRPQPPPKPPLLPRRPPPVPPARPASSAGVNSILDRPHPLRTGSPRRPPSLFATATTDVVQEQQSPAPRSPQIPLQAPRPPSISRAPATRRPAPPPPPTSASRRFSANAVDTSVDIPTSPSQPSSVTAHRRRPLPIPPAAPPPPPTGAAISASPVRVDAYTALRERIERLEREREREATLRRLVGSDEGVTGEHHRSSLTPSVSERTIGAERPRSATSSLEVPQETEQAATAVSAAGAHGEGDGETRGEEFAFYTDLDLLLARLEGEQAQRGENYEDLTVLGEVLGPAQQVQVGATVEELEELAVARVELERRRIDKHGKVKQKLSVVGVRCIDCSVCLARFRVDDLAVVLPQCLHAFHEKCIRSWLSRSRQCPLCRADVFPPRAPNIIDV